MINESEWVWYGYAGHLCVGRRCAYHLCTRIGNRLVSTVGHYLPKNEDKMEAIGAGSDSNFETMIFAVDGDEESGDPSITSYEELDCRRYATSIDAERGHRQLCLVVAAAQ